MRRAEVCGLPNQKVVGSNPIHRVRSVVAQLVEQQAPYHRHQLARRNLSSKLISEPQGHRTLV